MLLTLLKCAVILFGASTSIWAANWIYLAFQTEATTNIPKEPWYASPAFTAALAAGVFVIIARYVDKYLEAKSEKRKEEAKKKDETSDKHLSYSEKMEELTAQQWVEVINRRDHLHSQEVEFLQNQMITCDVAKYDVKERLNRAMSELTAVQAYTMKLKGGLIRAGVDFEDLSMRSYGEIMSDVEDKVVIYEESIRDRYKPAKPA